LVFVESLPKPPVAAMVFWLALLHVADDEDVQPKKTKMLDVVATTTVPPLIPTPMPNLLESVSVTLFASLHVREEADVQP